MESQVLTAEATEFLTELERRFGPRRRELLAARQERARRLRDGELPDFLPETADVREGDWRVDARAGRARRTAASRSRARSTGRW